MADPEPLQLDFGWAEARWSDPETGTDVVRLSPPVPGMHFHNAYFRIRMITRDGRKAVVQGADADGGVLRSLWCVDLESGEYRKLHEHERSGAWAVAPRSRLLHVVERPGDGAGVEIVRIDLDTGEQDRIRPSVPLEHIPYGETSADERYIYSHAALKKPRTDLPQREAIAEMGANPGRNIMYRTDLTDGRTEAVFECDDWWMGHPNPNPVYPNLFMCCQEGFGWTEEYPMPEGFHRVRIHDFERGLWLDMRTRMKSGGVHEHWSPAGRRVYSHGTGRQHTVLVNDVFEETHRRYTTQRDAGDSSHVCVAPDESFLVGDGRNFSRRDVGRLENVVGHRAGSSPWSWDGADNEAPPETIWKYTLPAESVCDEEHDSPEAFQAAVAANPEKTMAVTAVCRFRSMARLRLDGGRYQSNAHVTPDGRWAVFQSASEDRRFEVWAARIP